jgi:hypothetical protein
MLAILLSYRSLSRNGLFLPQESIFQYRTGVFVGSAVEDFKVRLADHFITEITRYLGGGGIEVDYDPIFVDYGKTYGEVLHDGVVYLLIFHFISTASSFFHILRLAFIARISQLSDGQTYLQPGLLSRPSAYSLPPINTEHRA